MKGYTLVELLIVIGIISLLATFGVTAFGRARERQSIQNAREKLLSTLQSAQKAAYVGDKDCTGSLIGIEVTFSGNTIQKQARCNNAGLPTSGVAQSTTVPDITFMTPAPVVTFRPLEQGITLSSGSIANIDYVISGATYRVEIVPPGTITYIGVTP